MEQIIATHIVKPSSPTPPDLKTHRFSFIDQIMPFVYVPLIFFYKNEQYSPHTQISQRHRQSLSEILSVFYPLAGTIKGNLSIDCDDSGVEMVEARIAAPLQHFTQDPQMEKLKKLLPTRNFPPHKDDELVLVKLSFFDCGGFALGVYFSHKMGDASSFSTFMNEWAATSRGEPSRIFPFEFNFALHFPPMDTLKYNLFIPEDEMENAKLVSKRFVFDAEKLEKLREKARKHVTNPSRVEALSGFIWKAAISTYKAKGSSSLSSSFIATHAVNMRPKRDPPIPDSSVGNCVDMVVAIVSLEEDERETERGVHVSKLRAAIRGVDHDYIKKVVEDRGKYLQQLVQVLELFKAEKCMFSSWWRFPFYEADFGWGKPDWVSTAALPYTNTTVFMSTPSGDGIEAWVNVSESNKDFILLLQDNYNALLLESTENYRVGSSAEHSEQ